VVTSTDGSPLEGPVIFHLHDTYPKSVIWIKKIRANNIAVLEQVESYEVYTIGAQVKDANKQCTGLEYSLADVPELPSRFLSK
jgi:hypothetical protein